MNVPLPQYTTPSATAGAALHGAPLSYDQSDSPVLAFSAYIVPAPTARLQPNTTPPARATAASARLPAGSFVVHFTLPVTASRAAHPPEVVTEPSTNVQGSAPTPPPFVDGPAFAAAT